MSNDAYTYTVYIIKLHPTEDVQGTPYDYYVGETFDVKKRIKEHREGRGGSRLVAKGYRIGTVETRGVFHSRENAREGEAKEARRLENKGFRVWFG